MAKEERERAFVKNGSKLLEKMIGTCNGKSTPIRNFSFQELKRATKNFDASLVIRKDVWTWYKGSLERRTIFIKVDDDPDAASIETQVPSVVFEFPANGSLAGRIHHVSDRSRTDQRRYEPMVWSSRLRVAREIAHAISYLHTTFSRPIIHRNINMENIFLDQHDVPKLSCFGMSISIPKGETHVKEGACGTIGYVCPEYFVKGGVTEKTDVYSFGVFLFELLTRQKSFDQPGGDVNESYSGRGMRNKCGQGHCINEIVDPTILQGGGGASISIDHQLQAVLELGFTCAEDESGMRPTMIDVTKALRRIEKSLP